MIRSSAMTYLDPTSLSEATYLAQQPPSVEAGADDSPSISISHLLGRWDDWEENSRCGLRPFRIIPCGRRDTCLHHPEAICHKSCQNIRPVPPPPPPRNHSIMTYTDLVYAASQALGGISPFFRDCKGGAFHLALASLSPRALLSSLYLVEQRSMQGEALLPPKV